MKQMTVNISDESYEEIQEIMDLVGEHDMGHFIKKAFTIINYIYKKQEKGKTFFLGKTIYDLEELTFK